MATRKKVVLEPSAGFRGFGSQALPFLRALRENNDREWFAEHKATYLEECDAPFRELIRDLTLQLEVAGIPFVPHPKNPVFRIYRDVRFTTDKSPYKTNLGAALHRDGDKSKPGMLYIHVEPERSFLASGFYLPEPALLKALRSAVAEEPDAFLKVLKTLEKNQGLELADAEPLSRIPKAFEAFADSPVADLLKKRSVIVRQPLLDDDLERRDLASTVVQFAKGTLPLLEFFWSRVEG